MLNDFEGMSQDEMMDCAAILEDPLKRLEEENKAKEAEELAAAQKAQAEADKKAKAAAEAKRKHQEEYAAIALAKSRESENQGKELSKLKEELGSCQEQYNSAVVEANSLAQCQEKLSSFEATHVAVDARLRTIFGSSSVEFVVAPLLALFCVLFWLLGTCIGSSRVTPMVPAMAGSSGVSISDVVIRPGNEVCVIKNRTFNDVVSEAACYKACSHMEVNCLIE